MSRRFFRIAASAAAAFTLCAASLLQGCVAGRAIDISASSPSICVRQSGLSLCGESVDAAAVVKALRETGVSKSATVHIHIEPDVRDLREARALMADLARAGWRRSVLVTKRHGESSVRDTVVPSAKRTPPARNMLQ